MKRIRTYIDFILVIVIAGVVFGAIYAYYNSDMYFGHTPVIDTVVQPPVPGLFTKPFYHDWNIPIPEVLPENFAENSYLYTNKKFGFSLRLPNASMNYFGACTQSGSQAVVHSANTPVIAVESGSTVYIGNSYEYETDEQTCAKTDATPNNPNSRWKIDYFAAVNDDAVQTWIQVNIGPNCVITSTNPWSNNNAFKSYEFNRDHETCPYGPYALLRNPNTSRAYFITFGPEAVFWRDAAATLYYDNQVLQSFDILH